MSTVNASVRRAVAMAVTVTALAIGAFAATPATAQAQLHMKITCQDVGLRDRPDGHIKQMMYQGLPFYITQWPTSTKWVYGYFIEPRDGAYGWTDVNCLAPAW